MSNLKENYKNKILPELKKEFSFPCDLAVPRITKVTVNAGIGAIKDSSELEKIVISDLASICGQQPKINKSRKSISGFKLREKQNVGVSATLRGERMYDFLEKLANVVLPRIRDFRGLSSKSFDSQGNYSIGFSEQSIFPEIRFDNVKQVFGLQVNITTTSKDKEQSKRLLEMFGFPFEKPKAEKGVNNG